MLRSAKTRFWGAVTRTLSDPPDGDRVMEWLASVQQVRVWVEELQGATLHLAALPTRQDVRRLHRRVVGLRRRVGELNRALAHLEQELAASEDEAAGDGAISPRP